MRKKISPEIPVFVAIIAFVAILSAFVNVTENSNGVVLSNLGKAPELAGISGWINTEPFTLAQMRGKVVLVDFWTYSCINCIRTLPYLKAWHEKYAGKGLVIVGVHTPEFEFEKDYSNVVNAVNKYGIHYRVVQDNDYATWRAYKNQYWPRKYLVDTNGDIRYDHIGEGGYEETENVIQQLLKEAGADVKGNMTTDKSDVGFTRIGTPEIYLGYAFARQPLGNSEGFRPGEIVDYKPAVAGIKNIVYLSGRWQNNADHMKSAGQAALTLIYEARDVNIVAGGTGKVAILLDNKPVGVDAGKDAVNGTVEINEARLYNIVSAGGYGIHKVDIIAEDGVEVYTFTFG